MHMTLSKNSGVVISAVSTLVRPPPDVTRPVAPTSFEAVAGGRDWSSRPYSEDVIVSYSGLRQKRTLVQQLTSLAAASGIALLVPIAILSIGIPIALAARALAEAVGWLGAWILN